MLRCIHTIELSMLSWSRTRSYYNHMVKAGCSNHSYITLVVCFNSLTLLVTNHFNHLSVILLTTFHTLLFFLSNYLNHTNISPCTPPPPPATAWVPPGVQAPMVGNHCTNIEMSHSKKNLNIMSFIKVVFTAGILFISVTLCGDTQYAHDQF